MQLQVHPHQGEEVEVIELEATVLVREILVHSTGSPDDVVWIEERDEYLDLDVTLVEAEIEHGHHIHRGPREITIIVNGRSKKVPPRPLTFERLVELAFDQPPTGPNVFITITYQHGRGGATGSLTPGKSIQPVERMVFDVYPTDRA